MYQTLWNSINKQVKNSHATATFLAVSLISWTTIGLLTGFLIYMIGGMSFVTKVTVVLCSGGYTGLIFGFFGGILYLYRTEPRHSTDSAPSQVSTVSQISLNEEKGSYVGVFSDRHFRYELFYHYIEHSSGSEA